MTPAKQAMGIFLFSQITVGMLGNSSILFYHVILIFTGKHLIPKDLIIGHLSFANCLSIISRGIPKTMSDFEFKYFLDDIGCKFILYIYRITRGVSLYIMCLLSCFQAITISPSNSRWMRLKHRATKFIGPSCSLSWLVHLLLNISTPAKVSGPIFNNNATSRISYGYCLWFASVSVATALYMFLLCITDGLCLGLMACSSVSMVTILYRHKRQVKHIHSAQHFLKDSPEDRAAQTILTLVCIFIISYSFFSIMVIFMNYSKGLMLCGISVLLFVEICFPIFYPIVLMCNIKYISSLYFTCCGKRYLHLSLSLSQIICLYLFTDIFLLSVVEYLERSCKIIEYPITDSCVIYCDIKIFNFSIFLHNLLSKE